MEGTRTKPKAEIVPLSEKERIELGGYYGPSYLHGHCVPLALALSRSTGKPLVAVRRRGGTLVHAGIRTGVKQFRDVRGPLDEAQFVAPYLSAGPLAVEDVSEQELLKEAPTSEEMVERATRHLTELFDDLPVTHEKDEKLRGFLVALGELCREHGYWLRGDTKSSIVLYEAYGEEAGYRASHVPGGTMHLERILDGGFPFPTADSN
ncbi:hypothetical protein [Bosea sp. RAC05]|uniref:hypothetical protein n=1 Tax=Bosea sp. RAC05 TaxID=1842539 RepID=UPI0008567247|nr:hypothetical protein [Bosea sp. RAC05]AOG02830.1 hypothetical protein BSY19_5179 [Bosea sp. RAC05]